MKTVWLLVVWLFCLIVFGFFIVFGFCLIVGEFATLLYTGPHVLRHPTQRVVQHLCREPAPGRPGVSMRVAFDVAGFIWSTLSRRIAQSFSMGDRSGPVARSYTFRPKLRELVLAPQFGLGGGVS